MDIVIVSEYNPEWIREYENERVRICNTLGDINLRIEHIGSTSILGLGSKPIIDIMVGVSDLRQITETHIMGLEKIGYEYVFKPDFPERRFFRRGQWRAGTHHLHIYKYMGMNWTNNILFREYLKKDIRILEEYFNLKKKLEQQYKHDRAAYTDGKSEYIERIIGMAMKDRELNKYIEEGNSI